MVGSGFNTFFYCLCFFLDKNENQKEIINIFVSMMTQREIIKEIGKGALSVIATVAGALIILSFTNILDEKECSKKELIRLDKEKATIDYVDRKVEKLEASTTSELKMIKENTQKIYDYLLNEKSNR
jgi:hypothetical protein